MRVTSLDLSKQRHTKMPYSEIDTNVNWLILSDNKIREIDPEIGNYTEMTRLAINDNRLERVDSEIGKCRELNWVDFTRNRLQSLPCEFGNLRSITGLGLSDNRFETIPDCVFKLYQLRKFGLFSNNIKLIPKKIELLQNLVKIDLSNNQISEIPEELCKVTTLIWLNLSNNKIRKIPKNINSLVNLEELGLGMNEIEVVPDLSGLRKLRIFPIFRNKIRSVHKSVYTLKWIEKLDYSDNCISEFPYEALMSKSLRYLNLRGNELAIIENLKIKATKCSPILMLDVSENKLQYVPYKLFKTFSTEMSLKVEGNPFVKLPPVQPTYFSLVEICFTKILAKDPNAEAAPWLKDVGDKIIHCDSCRRPFVVNPYKVYLESYVEPNRKFVVETYLCSSTCYNLFVDYKGMYMQ